MGRSKASEPVHEPLGAKVRRRADRQNIRRPVLKQAVCSDSDPIQRIANDSQVLLAAIRNDEALTFARASQFYYEKRFDEAIVQIQQHAPAAFANDPRIMTYLGYCQKFAGHDDEARATFTRAAAAMKPTPDSVVVIDARNLPCYLAWVYAGLGEKEKALEQARHAITDDEGDALSKPFAETSLAIVQARGDLIEAIFLVRAYRTTLPRFGYTTPVDTGNMVIERRVSVDPGELADPSKPLAAMLKAKA